MKQLQFVRDSQSFDSEHVKHLFLDQRQKHDVDLKVFVSNSYWYTCFYVTLSYYNRNVL